MKVGYLALALAVAWACESLAQNPPERPVLRIETKAEVGGKGKITVSMLDLYLAERVKELTGGRQTPAMAKPDTIPDLPLAVKR